MAGPGDTQALTFARWLFRIAGLYGLVMLLPTYLMEDQVGKEAPPYLPINHPEYYYGFIGVAVAWQVAFLVIGHDPVRYRPIMLPAVLEKVTFAGAAAVLYVQQRINIYLLVLGMIDLAFGVAFLVAWWRLRPPAASPPPTDV
jgi:hypothetical protein